MLEEDRELEEYERTAEKNSVEASYRAATGIALETLSLNFWTGFIGDSFQDAASEVDLYVDTPLQVVGYTVNNPEITAPVTTLAGAALLLDAGRKYYRASRASSEAGERRDVLRSLDELEEELEDSRN